MDPEDSVGFRPAEMKGEDCGGGRGGGWTIGETFAKLPRCKATRECGVSLLRVAGTIAAAFELKKKLKIEMIYIGA